PDTGDRLFNRPPRIAVPDRLPELVVPAEPAAPRGFRFPWLTTLLPLVLCGALYLSGLAGGYGQYLLLMMALSPLMMLTNLIGERRGARREYAAAKLAFSQARAAFEGALARIATEEEHATRAAYPDPAEIVARAVAPASTLWQRRRTDPDFLRLRVGLVDRPARVALRRSSPGDDPPELPVLHDVPLTVDLPDAGVLGVAGPRTAILAAGRALLTQAAVLHAPADLGVVVITGRDTASDWEWATWLPHTLPASSAFGCVRMIATDAAQAEARLSELRRLVEERSAERRTALAAGLPVGRAMLVVLDGARRLRDLPGLAELLATGPAAGVYALCLDAEETALPDECGATVVATGTRATVRRPGLAPVDDVLLDGLVAPAAIEAARALAPLRALGERGGDSALPDRVRFTDLAGLGGISPDAVRRRWAASPEGRSTSALLGVGPDGPVTVDLKREGPHALVAGTSGAGKSELLQTLVTSLALANTPDALTFVLVDYKGGSAFAACADLPHCVGMVTDLDGHLVTRALDSLSAELRRREALFAEVGAKDIEDFWARTKAGPGPAGGARLPRLVIVVDEFASLVEEVPEFVPGVVGIGMRGRSLGVHVVLATQRPAGVVTADLRANVNLRISLRVTNQAESLDVIDAPDAARIPVRQPGRAYLRTGHTELTAFQVGRVGWPKPVAGRVAGPPVRVEPRRVDALGRAVAREEEATEGPTDLVDLVAAIRAAALDAVPPRPWLPPLPDLVPLAVLPEASPGSPVAAVVAPSDLHLYGLDCGNRALAPLAALPHCGAVVDGDDDQRVDRLLALLYNEVGRRQRRLAAGGHGSLAEQRAAAAPGDRLPYLVLLLDRLETFVARYAELDRGRLVERVEGLLRTGPAVGIICVLATDRTGFHPRIASAVAARLVLRQATVDDVAAFGLDPRRVPRRMPPGRAVWAASGEEVQVAVLDPDPAGAVQAAAVERLGAVLAAQWDGSAEPRRIDPLPTEILATSAGGLRRAPRPAGPTVCTPAVGGDHLVPLDVELSGTFLVAGPQRSGRSTALVSIVTSLDRTLPVLVVAPRPSPLRDLPGCEVLTGDPGSIALRIADAAAVGPVALVVDDGELIADRDLSDVLEGFARDARDQGSVLIAAATTEDLLANPYRGWLAAVRRSRSGLLLDPASYVDGEVFGLRLPRSVAGGWPPGRGLLVQRGEDAPVQVILPDPVSV
ncbi:MAG: hypothetical protein AUI14_15615, partial [Actinobacteria bacterium 13_2_20CM_2_71_6]